MSGNPESLRTIIPLWQGGARDPSGHAARVLRHWSDLAADGGVPRRSDLCPKALGPALPHAFLVEQVRPGAVRFRLAGQRLADLMGMDVRGMPLRAFFEIPDRRPLMDRVGRVFAGPATLRLDLVSDAQGFATLSGQMLLLPMRDRTGAVTRALGVLTVQGAIGLTPRRFRIRQDQLAPLGNGGSGVAPKPGRPVLTLIEGGRR